MVTKKDLIIAVLITFCLTAIMFIATPIRSSTNTYNPLADLNHDGTINLQDLVLFAQSYGTTGDPTANVNVTNWPTTTLQNYTDAEEYTVWDESRLVNGTEYGAYTISCGGPFAFSPKQNFIAVTNFIYIIQAYNEGTGSSLGNFSFDINGVTVEQNALQFQDYYPTYAGANITLACNYIHPGLNNVHFQFQNYVFVMKITVWVEYTYQA